MMALSSSFSLLSEGGGGRTSLRGVFSSLLSVFLPSGAKPSRGCLLSPLKSSSYTRHGLSTSRDGARRFQRLVSLSLLWMILLILLSPSSPFPPPSFSSLFLLLPPTYHSHRQTGFFPSCMLKQGERRSRHSIADSTHSPYHTQGRTSSHDQPSTSSFLPFISRGVHTPEEDYYFKREHLPHDDDPCFLLFENISSDIFNKLQTPSLVSSATSHAFFSSLSPSLPSGDAMIRSDRGNSLQDFFLQPFRSLQSSWLALRDQLPRAVYTEAIERDKFKLSCTQASFCHRYLHWVDLFAKKIPRASVTPPPLYTVDTKSLPRPTWEKSKSSNSRHSSSSSSAQGDGGNAGKNDPKKDAGGGGGAGGGEQGGEGGQDHQHRHEKKGEGMKSETAPPLGFTETKKKGKGEKTREEDEEKEKKKGGGGASSSSSSSEKPRKKKSTLKGSDKAPSTVLSFDILRGSDGLRLQAKLFVYRHGIVRLRMKEKRDKKEKEDQDSALRQKEPQNTQAPVFRLNERFERYDGFTADILQLEDVPKKSNRLNHTTPPSAGGTRHDTADHDDGEEEQQVKISYSGNATVVDFLAEPPTSRAKAFTDAFVSEFFRKKSPKGTFSSSSSSSSSGDAGNPSRRMASTATSSSKHHEEGGGPAAKGEEEKGHAVHFASSGNSSSSFSQQEQQSTCDSSSSAEKKSDSSSSSSSFVENEGRYQQNLGPEATAFFDPSCSPCGDGMNIRIVLQHTPFALRVYVHHKLVQEVNEKQLLNWEAFLPVHVKAREAAEAEGRQQIEERHRRDLPPEVPSSISNQSSAILPEQADAEASKVAQLATSAGVDLTEKLKGLRGIEWRVGEPLGDDLDEEREVMNDIIMPLLHAGEIRDAVDLFRYGAMEEAFDRFLDSKPFGPTAIGVDVTFWGAAQVYGLFEHAAPYPLKSYTEPYRLYNLDVFNYELDSPFSTYGSMPFLMALHAPTSGNTTTPAGSSLHSRRPSRSGFPGGGRYSRRSSFSSKSKDGLKATAGEADPDAHMETRKPSPPRPHPDGVHPSSFASKRQRRGSFSSFNRSSSSFPTAEAMDPRSHSSLVTGFMILNPTEIWMKLRYDQGGEDLPESYAGLNEEEDDDDLIDSITRRHKRARHRLYESFASRESLHWDMFHTTPSRWSRSRYEALRTWWVAEGGVFDILMFLGPTPQDVHRQYHIATGLPSMPPMFALSKHQCRWNYNDQADVLAVDRGFDENSIPYDVIWIDIEHTNQKRYFTWDKKTFPDPPKMIEDITKKNRKVVTIVDPHIKAAQDYYVYQEALQNDFLVRNPLGGVFHGHCWPGDSVYADFLNPQVRAWWRELFAYERYKYSTPDLWIWNDMNEPSVFSGPELSMPKDLLHMNGLLEHREIHNLYGHYHHRSTYEGLLMRGKGEQRPFLLTRSTFLGSHRFGFVWTGDNRAEWTHMAASVPMILSAAACGMSAVGADVDGFFADTPEELHIRWQQLGIFYPFYRSHAHMDTKRREPWMFSRQSIDIVRSAVELRYKLLPLWYTLFAEYAATGDPVVRPFWWLDPLSTRMQQEQQAFLVGSELSVHPVLHPMEDIIQQQDGDDEINIGLVRDGGNVWYDLFSGLPFFISSSNSTEAEATVKYRLRLENIPVFVRGGTILITKERLKRTSAHMFLSPYTIHIYPSAPHPGGAEFHTAEGGGPAYGRLYVDDYNSFKYLDGKFVYEGFAYGQEKSEEEEGRGEQDNKESEEGGERNVSSSSSLHAKTWTLRSTALPLELLDSEHDEPLQGKSYRDFPHSEVERIVLWSVPARPVRVYVKQRGGGKGGSSQGGRGGEEDGNGKIEEIVDEEEEEKNKKIKEEEANLNIENREERDLLFSVEEIKAPHHITQTEVLGKKVFYRVDVKLPKIHIGRYDWSVHFMF